MIFRPFFEQAYSLRFNISGLDAWESASVSDIFPDL